MRIENIIKLFKYDRNRDEHGFLINKYKDHISDMVYAFEEDECELLKCFFYECEKINLGKEELYSSTEHKVVSGRFGTSMNDYKDKEEGFNCISFGLFLYTYLKQCDFESFKLVDKQELRKFNSSRVKKNSLLKRPYSVIARLHGKLNEENVSKYENLCLKYLFFKEYDLDPYSEDSQELFELNYKI